MQESAEATERMTVAILFWPSIADQLDITLQECQEFLVYFHDEVGCYTTAFPGGETHGTLFLVSSLRQRIEREDSGGLELPIHVQYVYDHVLHLIDPPTDYIWFWNCN